MDSNISEAEDNPKQITINVGGKHFTCRISTLMQSEFFARLFNGEWREHINENGSNCLFIDRNPNVFEYVLDYLRGSFMLPENDEQRQRILIEADYFGVISMVAYLNAKASDDKLILVTIGRCPSRNVSRRFIRQARYNGFHELFRLYKQNYEAVLDTIEAMEITVDHPTDGFWTACLSVALFGDCGLTNLKVLKSSNIGLLPLEMYIGTFQLARDMHMPIPVIKVLGKRLKEAYELIMKH